MIPEKVIEHLEEYISQEVYVQIAVIKGKEKGTTKSAINKYFSTNHFKDLSDGRPYDHFIDGLKDKCLIKLINSPMRDKETDDEVIKELQLKLNNLSEEELKDTYWEIETGEYLSGKQVKELEDERDQMIKKLDLENNLNKLNIDTTKYMKGYFLLIVYYKKFSNLCYYKFLQYKSI